MDGLKPKKKKVPPIFGRQDAPVEVPEMQLGEPMKRENPLPPTLNQQAPMPMNSFQQPEVPSFSPDNRPVLSPLDRARTDYLNAVNSKPEHQKPGLQALHFILEGIKKFTNPNDTSPVMWLGEAKRQRSINEAESRLKPLLALQEQDMSTQMKQAQLQGVTLENQGRGIQNQLNSVKAGDFINDKGYTDVFEHGDSKYGVTPRGNVKPLPVPKDPNKASYPYKTGTGQTVMAPGSTVINADQNNKDRISNQQNEVIRSQEKQRVKDDEIREKYFSDLQKYNQELNEFNLKRAKVQGDYDSAITESQAYISEADTYQTQAAELRRAAQDDTLLPAERQSLASKAAELELKSQQSRAKASAAQTNANNQQRLLKSMSAPSRPTPPTYSRNNGKSVTMAQIRQAANGYKAQQAQKNISVSDEEALEYATEMARSQGYTISTEKPKQPKKKK